MNMSRSVSGRRGLLVLNEGVGFLRAAAQEDLKSTLVPPYSNYQYLIKPRASFLLASLEAECLLKLPSS